MYSVRHDLRAARRLPTKPHKDAPSLPTIKVIALLRQGGRCSTTEIAQVIFAHDEARETHLAAPYSVDQVHPRDAQVRGPEAGQVLLRVVRGSDDVRALEADHIVPRDRGGTGNPDNSQVLCYPAATR